MPDQPGAEVGEEGVNTQDTLHHMRRVSHMRRRTHACLMRRRIHACHMRRYARDLASLEEEDTCMSYEEEDTCMPYEEIRKRPCFPGSTRWSESACM